MLQAVILSCRAFAGHVEPVVLYWGNSGRIALPWKEIENPSPRLGLWHGWRSASTLGPVGTKREEKSGRFLAAYGAAQSKQVSLKSLIGVQI